MYATRTSIVFKASKSAQFNATIWAHYTLAGYIETCRRMLMDATDLLTDLPTRDITPLKFRPGECHTLAKWCHVIEPSALWRKYKLPAKNTYCRLAYSLGLNKKQSYLDILALPTCTGIFKEGLDFWKTDAGAGELAAMTEKLALLRKKKCERFKTMLEAQNSKNEDASDVV